MAASIDEGRPQVIVADANIVTYLMVEGPFTERARAAYALDADWRLPPLWRHQYMNALLVLVRAGEVATRDAQKRLLRGLRTFQRGEEEVSQRAAMRMAIRRRVSGYDAQYLALAQMHGVRCLTEDRLLLERAAAIAISLTRFLNP
jgi:predicted nucleic acid-binding protein